VNIINNSKLQAPNSKSQTISNVQIANSKHYDLEERTFEFAKRVIEFTKKLPKTMANIEIASGSVGANYIEANEALSKKDFALRIKICRKESKESRYWLKLVEIKDNNDETERELLIKEASEFIKIFSKILEKTK
jgi:four helix bundle protein